MRYFLRYFYRLLKHWLDWWQFKPIHDYSGNGRHIGWYDARKRHLKKENRCCWCGGRICLEVHTILPWNIFPSEQLNEKNLITLCEAPDKNCHFNYGHSRKWMGYVGNIRELCEKRKIFLKNEAEKWYNVVYDAERT
jgi:hypothetical protein